MELTFKDLFGVIKKRWIILAIVTVIFAAAGILFSSVIMEQKYESKATTLIIVQRPPEAQDKILSETNATTIVKAMATADVIFGEMAIKARQQGVGDFNPADLKRGLSVAQSNQNVNILNFTFTWSTPEKAQKLLTIYSDLLTDYIDNIDITENKINVMFSERPTLIKKAVSPNKILYTLVAAILGFIASAVVVLVVEFGSDRVKFVNNVGYRLNAEVIGEIPCCPHADDCNGGKSDV